MKSRCQTFAISLASLAFVACARDHSERADAGIARDSPRDASASAGRIASSPREIGARAMVRLEAVAAEQNSAGVTGMAMFSQTEDAVTVSMMILQCRRDAKPYEVYIKEGADCSAQTLEGPNWDGARGEGLQAIQCATTSFGRAFYSRAHDDDNPWSIGAPSASDLLGHALVVVEAGSGTPVACGVIVREEVTPMTDMKPSLDAKEIERLAPIAGVCLGRALVRSNTQECPDSEAVVKCAMEHCDLQSCNTVCSDYTACLARTPDACAALFECPLTEACSTCQLRVQGCATGFCLEHLACAAPPMPDGPCTQLAACCAMQGDQAASCLETVKLLEQLSGDVSCAAAMKDWDFFAHLTVACEFE